jgi:glyoxylate reductase
VSKPKVYVGRKLHDSLLTRLAQTCEVRAWTEEGRCPDEVLLQEIAEAEGFLGNSRWTGEVMDHAPKMKVIANIAVGYDNVDVAAATERGIIVTNTPGVLTDTTADTAFALLMAAARRVGEAERFMRAGKWTMMGGPASFFGRDVHHATLGIVGLGRIGQAVAKRGAQGFDMRVIYYDTVRREDLEQQFGYRFVDMDTLLRESDFVSLHVNLSADTHHMINAEALAKMKPTAVLVNAGRGPLVDEEALVEALKSHQIFAAGLDVFEQEPTSPSNPLFALENVAMLPHIGSATQATREAMAELACDNVLNVLAGKAPITPVNPEVMGKLKK